MSLPPWTARWTAVYYLASNGLFGKLPGSDEPRNRGHRGFPPAIHAVRWDEIAADEIAHVLKIAVRRTASQAVYPAGGHERALVVADSLIQRARKPA